MGFELHAVQLKGHVYRYEQYLRDPESEREKREFASYCYSVLTEEAVKKMRKDFRFKCSVEVVSMNTAYAVGMNYNDYLTKTSEDYKRMAEEEVREIISNAEQSAAWRIVNYLYNNGGVIDSWPEKRIHIAFPRVIDSSVSDPEVVMMIAVAINDYLENEVTAAFHFPRSVYHNEKAEKIGDAWR